MKASSQLHQDSGLNLPGHSDASRLRAAVTDIDATETREWLEALASVLKSEGPSRANFLIEQLWASLSATGARLPDILTTPYRNTIPVAQEAQMPGDSYLERKLRSLVRWNALAMVVRASKRGHDLGGHIATYASAATLYEVGFNHFFRGDTQSRPGDLVYFQGHSSPGIYARSFLEGGLSASQLDHFRQEVHGGGLSSYPHPWLMPHYWQFPTVSMGLGPLQAIHQAHVMKYLDNRNLVPRQDRKVWVFLGDGECDEPESLAALNLAGREQLDNVIFVVNCNLQRLDGPVRGNGKIIQELERTFRGAGWNVIKVIWGRAWDSLFAQDRQGHLLERMNETVDGEYQSYKARGGAYTREHFFGKHPELLQLVAHLSDDDIMRLNRGGHDPFKVYAAYHAASHHRGEPSVILAKTVKGYGMGDAGEAENNTHQIKKLDYEGLKRFRDRFDLPISDGELEAVPFYRPAEDTPEMRYLKQQRAALGGTVPRRSLAGEAIEVPQLQVFNKQLEGTGERSMSTTMAFARMLSVLLKEQTIASRVIPIVPDEARTFGLEPLFNRIGIYSTAGQLYEPADAGTLTAYTEREDGQVLEEGLNEAGAFATWMAAATSYSSHRFTLIPFYIYYSMFGFQRVGDLAWAAGDIQARGFLLGATAGRTTLNGEGLQHQDGHSHLLASTIPNCIAYDPCYAYELAVIVHSGLRRMIQEGENVFFYITLMNESYPHPGMPAGVEQDILKGMYTLRTVGEDSDKRVRLLGSGTILREVEAAANMLHERYGVYSEIFSVTSFTELARQGQDTQRWNMLHPESTPRRSHVADMLPGENPVIAASDFQKAVADQIRSQITAPYHVLGTDGFGRSDSRAALREFFEVDRRFIVLAALKGLCDCGILPAETVEQARSDLDIDPEKANPRVS